MPQLSITSDPLPAFEGEIAYPMMPRVVVSRSVTGANIPFGAAVSRAADRTVRLPAAAADITATFEGFAVRQEYREDNGLVGYQANAVMPVMRKGYIWVGVEGAVTEEGAVFARVTANGPNTQLGALRGDADGGNATAVPNARFVSSTTAAGLAIVEVW